jgi:hypothetical protein
MTVAPRCEVDSLISKYFIVYHSNYSVDMFCAANNILAIICLLDSMAFYTVHAPIDQSGRPISMTPDTADVSSRVTVEVFNSVAVLFHECNNTRTVDSSGHRHVPPARALRLSQMTSTASGR